jgi:transporter family protein
MYIFLAILSSLFLGFHEIFKKISLNQNAVPVVLFLGSVSAGLIFLPLILLSHFYPEFSRSMHLFIPPSNTSGHLFFLLKSLIVSLAWLFGYYAVKHLPVTLLSPLNASGPIWTILGAMVIYHEKLNSLQWMGVIVCLAFYFALSFDGNIRGAERTDRRWILFAFLGILFNSASGLLDKYIVNRFDRISMQAWFTLYTAGILFIILLLAWVPVRQVNPFRWRWAIAGIGIFLVIADFFYFKALSMDHALVSVITIIRRVSALVVFGAGALYFRETSIRRRGLILTGILTGVILVVMGTVSRK